MAYRGAMTMGGSMGCIRIERSNSGFEVHLTDPEIQAQNDKNKEGDNWQDPCVEYTFENKDQVLAFLDKALDIALPESEYSSSFDKLAEEAQKS